MIHHFIYILLTWSLTCAESNHSKKSEIVISELTRELVHESIYNKDVRPNFGGDPVEVKVSIEVIDISSLSEVNMDFTVDFAFRQYWHDSRLAFGPVENLTWMTVGVDFASKIWRPNTCVLNAKKLEQQSSVGQSTFLIRVKPTGDVLYSARIIVVATCSIDLKHFPADRQICSLEFESFDYTVEDLFYTWLQEKRALLVTRASLTTFTYKNFRASQRNRSTGTGIYSDLIFELYFERSLVFYLYQIYIPAFLIVVISWIPFWLDRDHHARVGLGVTIVLTITTLTTSTMASLPKVSYLKAIDLYLFACFLMVFLSLVEYAIVGFLEYKLTRSAVIKDQCDHTVPIKRMLHVFKQESRIDHFSRIAFPFVFITFNLLYASYILYVIRN